ncbi:hypothetical protein [Micromonospora zamorensis]|uniref:hypothetical protein n=1 Tax=Micromonospora zamorensis TaxID=709883 RepID=UPI0033A42706
MSPRWDDPKPAAESPDDDDTRRSENTELSEDRDRGERSPEPGDGRDTEGPGTRAETLDPAEERAATDEASLRERMLAGTQRVGEVAGASVGALVVSVSSMFGWDKTDDKLPEAARALAATSEIFEEAGSAAGERKDDDEAADEPNQVVDPQEQLPPDQEGEQPETPSPTVDRSSAEGLHPDTVDDD